MVKCKSCPLIFSLFLPLLITSCSFDFGNVPEGAQITCKSNADCPGSWICNTVTGFCVKEIDPNPPKLTATLSPLFVKKDAVVTLSFYVDKDLHVDPDVRVKMTGSIRQFAKDSARSSGRNYIYTYSSAGNEPESEDSHVLVTIIDKSGNRAEDVRVGTLRFDFNPPGLVPGSTLQRLASDYPANPVLNAASLTNGTTVSITFGITEDLYVDPIVPAKSSPLPEVVICKVPDCNPANPDDVMPLDLNTKASIGKSYTFDGKVTGIPANSDFLSKIYIVPGASGGIFDAAINVLDKPLEITQLPVKTSSPGTPFVSNVRYKRIPWGMKDPASGTFMDKKFSVVCDGCMYPSDTEMVLVYDSPAASTGGLIGFALNPGTGSSWSFSEIPLSGSDRAHVYMATADSAGNISPVTEIKSAEWIATMGYKVPGSTLENPHSIIGTAIVQKKLVQDQYVSEPEVFKNQGFQMVYQAGRQRWENRTPPEIVALPSARYSHALAYDSARKKVVLFGGEDSNSRFLNNTWEWDGANWEQKIPDKAPSERCRHALAYDSARGKVVLFGGVDSMGRRLNDTWEWNGTTWEDKATDSTPQERSEHALAYDGERGKVVLFGGWSDAGKLNDTWEWDGTSWVQKSPLTIPPVRHDHALAYDSVRGKVVMFGGASTSGHHNDTWEWDGTNWEQKMPDTAPSNRYYPALAYNSISSKVVLFGGYAFGGGYFGDTWEWDGTSWVQKSPDTTPPDRYLHALAYDSARGRIVLFGGSSSSGYLNDTWEWDGANWEQKIPDTVPSERYWHALAYDSTREKVMMFGGGSGKGSFNDSWEWDGTNWTQKVSENSPPARLSHSLAYDNARGKVLLFGGSGSGSLLDDTWEWDGANWAQKVPVLSPPARNQHGLAYDSARGTVVLFGGYVSGGIVNDTWEWDGANWAQKAPNISPPARSSHALSFDKDSGKVVLFGGCITRSPIGTCSKITNDTWEWDGANWTQKTPITSPSARFSPALAYDSARGKVVLFGGCTGPNSSGSCPNIVNDTWEWDGVNWEQKIPGTSPLARERQALTYDSARGKVVLFGGYGPEGKLNDTWEWDGANWTQKVPTTSPPARSSTALAYDDVRARVLLFGGKSSSSNLNDTWVWDGANWAQKVSDNSPPARYAHSLAYDNSRDKVLLFGGWGSGSRLNDTWEWDGANWTQKVPTTSPPARLSTELAYDSMRGKVLMFGGNSSSGYLNDTWEWDGTTWIQKVPTTSPPALSSTALAYDSARGKAVLFGGYSDAGKLNETWEWDGSNWTQKAPEISPPARGKHALAYDSARGKVVLFGGHKGDGRLNDTWEWDGENWSQRMPGTNPPMQEEHDLTYDSARGKVVLFGGQYYINLFNDTWEWDGQGNGRPGQVFNIVPKSTGVFINTSGPQVQSLYAKFVSGGIGYPQGVITNGVNLMAWYDNEWHTVAGNSDGPKSPGLVEWNTTDEKMIWKLLYGGGMNFNFAVVPQAPNGFGNPNCPPGWTVEECDMGMVSTEYVEVTLKYTLP